MNLDEALAHFDRTETNLARLDSVWQRMQELIPDGISFPGADPQALRYEELARGFADLSAGLPAIDGFLVEAVSNLYGDRSSQTRC